MRAFAALPLLALAGCVAQGAVSAPAPYNHSYDRGTLFECSDGEWAVKLLGTPDGKLVLLTNPVSRRGSSGNAASQWQEVRKGYVTGQGGGHQSHIRLYDGFRQIVLFEGANGPLTDDPGRTYAGAFTTTATNPAQDFRIACAADGKNARVIDNVRDWAERTGGSMPVPEDEGGDWDGWF